MCASKRGFYLLTRVALHVTEHAVSPGFFTVARTVT